MGWFVNERGPAWKHGWTENTLASMSPPPMPLLAIFSIILLLISLSSYANMKEHVQHSAVHFKLFLLFLPVLLIILAQCVSKWEGLTYSRTKAPYGSVSRSWELPWGVIGLVVVLLVLVSYRTSFRSMWSPIVWRSD